MSDEEKLLTTFDEIGITYVLDKEDGYTSVYIAAEGDTLEEAKRYDHLIEFQNGALASF